MKKIFLVLFTLLFTATIINAGDGEKKMKSIYDFTVKDINGKEVKLNDYKGKVLLIVNVASKCGYTKQYAGLEKIYDEYKAKGFEILAFPCNDFGGQEPGTNKEIQEFCSTKFDVSFPLFDKVKVLGDDKAPLYSLLTNNDAVEKGDIKWNFEKFLISKDGKIIERFRSKVEPESKEMKSAIEKELAKK
ncbi:MAG: glutathione peroxidase [Melioribacteraceae bacterium]|nr:glutathione peroxidase [Melioribacteraceae bacterium]